jgi:putative flippase GtrA
VRAIYERFGGFWRLVRFAVVGVSATLTHAGASLAALHLLDVAPLVANGIGFCCAFLVSLTGHAWFTFRQRLDLGRVLRFTVVAGSSVAFSSLMVFVGENWTSLSPNVYLPAAAVLTPAFNFICHSLWTFRRAPGIVD